MSANKDVMDKLTYGELRPRWQCRFSFHKWTRWRVIHEKRDILNYHTIEQMRECEYCGLKQLQVTDGKKES